MTDRIQRIINHPLYRENLRKNELCETEREFCHHDMAHFLDVARIAEILNLKESLAISEEYIYAAALLHDIGRHEQYREGTPHEKASIPIAMQILEECSYKENEIEVITTAIAQHRTKEVATQPDLSGILYRADKLSRACFSCKAEKDCNWKGDKKNLILKQ